MKATSVNSTELIHEALVFWRLKFGVCFLGFEEGGSSKMTAPRIYTAETEKLLKEKGLKCVCELCDCG